LRVKGDEIRAGDLIEHGGLVREVASAESVQRDGIEYIRVKVFILLGCPVTGLYVRPNQYVWASREVER